jgi:SAM-dependent methyltransferase
MTAGDIYTREFFLDQRTDALTSARHVVPIVMDLVAPRSVVDVGCGVGAWLAAFAEHGVVDFVGLDGGYVDRSALMIPPNRFLGCDLEVPIELDRRFELAVSLEVAEHLPEQSARTFVRSLTQLAPVILFGAAVPGQGGTRHVNEQWPSYWAARFAEHDFLPVDALRPLIWENDEVAWWYAQNTLLFVSSAEARTSPQPVQVRPGRTMDLVHPKMWEQIQQHAQEVLTTRRLLAMLPLAITRSIGWRIFRVPRSRSTT